jgi:hypothetical protein
MGDLYGIQYSGLTSASKWVKFLDMNVTVSTKAMNGLNEVQTPCRTGGPQ